MEDYYYELTIKPEKELNLFNSLLLEIFDDAIEQKNDLLILRSNEKLDDILWACEQFALKIGIKIETKLEKLKNIDWIESYKNSIQPVKIGSFYIRPQWAEKKSDCIDIIINPALAFGSGHHETTSSCLKILDDIVKRDNTILDVGTGSGILAIAASKKGAIVDICDTDALAVDSAKDNFLLNKEKYNEAWIGSSNFTQKKYDIVIANIIADIIILISDDLKNRVDNGGILILSGIIDKYFEKICKKFKDFKQIKTIKKDEWYTFVLQK